eukprot:gene12062-13699_t
MKLALSQSVANHFPDYSLDWVLRVDASDRAVGAVLYQERPDDYGMFVHEPIGFASQKFSSTASSCILEYPGLREPKVSFQDPENLVYALTSNNDEPVAQDGEQQ